MKIEKEQADITELLVICIDISNLVPPLPFPVKIHNDLRFYSNLEDVHL